MTGTVDVVIPVEPQVAAWLSDARNREVAGRIVSRMFAPHPLDGAGSLAEAIAEARAGARAAGLTDAEIDAELAAYNAERRGDRDAG